jgi:hypothetical protein
MSKTANETYYVSLPRIGVLKNFLDIKVVIEMFDTFIQITLEIDGIALSTANIARIHQPW